MKLTPIEAVLYVPLTVAVFVANPKWAIKMLKFNKDTSAASRNAERDSQ